MLTILYTCIRARMYTTWLSRTLSTQTVTDRTVPTVTNTCSTLLQANNRSTCTSWAPTEHALIKSQSHQRISHIPVNFQSTCTQFAINLLICNSILLAINLHTICNQPALCNTTTWSGIQIACNLQSTCSLQYSNFNWHSNCLQFAIRCSLHTTSTGIQIAINSQSTCSLQHYNFNWHSNCLQFAIRCSLPTTSTGIQIACNLKPTCSLQHYNFNWHPNCLQLAIRCSLPTTSSGIQIAYNLQSTCFLQNYFNWHSNYLQLAIRCSLPTTSTGIPTACNLHSVDLCLQLPTLFKGPQFATCLLFACSYFYPANARNLQVVCLLPTTTTGIQIARKVAIRLLFAYHNYFATRFSDLHLLHVQYLRKVNTDISQIICEPCHATNCILSARHALILMVSQYSDPVQAFENVIFWPHVLKRIQSPSWSRFPVMWTCYTLYSLSVIGYTHLM